MKSLIERTSESEVKYIYNESKRCVARKQYFYLRYTCDINVVRSQLPDSIYNTGSSMTEKLEKEILEKFPEVHQDDGRLAIITKAKCHPEDEYNEKVGKRITQRKSEIILSKIEKFVLTYWSDYHKKYATLLDVRINELDDRIQSLNLDNEYYNLIKNLK